MTSCRKKAKRGCVNNRRSFRTLDAIVDDYIRTYRSTAQKDWDFFENSQFQKAIEYAALAKDREGKRFSHQRRLTRENLRAAYSALLTRQSDLAVCKTFEQIHRIVQGVTNSIWGLGKLYTYDTALRLAAHLNCPPDSVYLHAGVTVGAKRLGLLVNREFLPLNALPLPLRRLKAHEIEDLLCIYKNQLGGVA